PKDEPTQLDMPFPEQLLGTLDEKKFSAQLTKEQVAKIVLYKEEMSELIGEEAFQKLMAENQFQSSESDLIGKIATEMITNPKKWNGLGYLNSAKVNEWNDSLYKLIKLQPAGWESEFSTVVEFTKVIRSNWMRSIPEQLERLD